MAIPGATTTEQCKGFQEVCFSPLLLNPSIAKATFVQSTRMQIFLKTI